MAGESGLVRFLRAFMFPMALKVSFPRTRMLATVTGLDHELPDRCANWLQQRAP
jgi:hypothetical protein